MKNGKNSMSNMWPGFTTSSSVKRHVKTVHQHVKSFKCDQCPSTFSRKINLINHKVQQHQIHLVCEAVFGTNYALNRHIETLHQSCDQCPLTFATRENLRRHIKSVHEGRKKYECVL